MSCDAVIISVSDYPHSRRLFRPLPGAALDGQRVHSWLQSHTKDIKIDNFVWPPVLPVGEPSWNALSIGATMQRLVINGLINTGQRLFLYASAHGMAVPASVAMPAVYCASHYPPPVTDIFLSSGWVPQLTAAPIYKEYLCFFDCCNDSPLGILPAGPSLNLPLRNYNDLARVLVVAACRPGQQALDTPTGGVFTDVLLEALSGSAGARDTAAVTAADVVAYLKENVPIRAGQVQTGHVQTPVEWFIPSEHTDLKDFVLFDREPLDGVDVTFLLAGHTLAEVEVLGPDLRPVGAVQAGPADTVRLPRLFPGKYVLRSKADGWTQAIRLKTTVAQDGSVTAKAEALDKP